MNVALDATPLTLSQGGIVRYVRELSLALAEEFPEDRFTLMSDQPFCAPGAQNLQSARGPRTWLENRWWLCGVRRTMAAHRIDLFHGTNFVVPWLAERPSVLTLHDLSPWLDPAWQRDARFVRRRTPLMIGLGLATRIITPSQAIRRAAIQRFGIRPERIHAIPHAASPHFWPVPASPSSPYFLCVSVAEPRKNLNMLVGAWREVYQRHRVELVLAGPVRSDFVAPLPEPGLRLLRDVDEAALPALYSGAIACLYPSLYEGFGLPVLEAMQCGALVLTSRDPAIAEVAAGAAVLLDPCDARSWTEAMCAAAAGSQALIQLRARAIERAKGFTWRRTARLTRQVYQEAQDAFGG